MSNGRGKIEIIKPFGEAFELMKKILFQPFDFKKWFVIGFAAFLSGHISGVNLPLGNWGSTRTEQAVLSPNFEEWKPWRPIIITVFVTAILIQRESGGNLAEVLEKVAHVIRERFRLKRQIRVHTAQGRLTG